MDKKISSAVIKRLPRYYRFLGELIDSDISRISSKELSKKMNVTASQIRQDLNNFGCFGQQGYGYNVISLFEEIQKILGLNNRYNLIIVGAGNLGQALLNYNNFQKRGYNFIGVFDVNPEIIGNTIKGIEVFDMSNLKQFVQDNVVHIAAITVPRISVPEVSKQILDTGITAIWNFSNSELILPSNIIVENVHLTDSLMTLTYNFNCNDESK